MSSVISIGVLGAAATGGADTDFFASAGEVIPILLLALAWESKFMERLSGEPDRSGFWKKRNVAIWSYVGTAAALLAEALCLLILASLVHPGDVAKSLVLFGLAALIGSIGTRVFAEIRRGTQWPPQPGGADKQRFLKLEDVDTQIDRHLTEKGYITREVADARYAPIDE